MSEKITFHLGGKSLIIETGSLAKQAMGSALVTCGETVVLTALTNSLTPIDADFFPLTCDYREQTSAAGKIPGGFFKREGRPTEREILTSRLMDRSIRPLFPENFRNEVQVIATVLSADQENDPDILALFGASAALCLSGLPFHGPVGSVRVGRVNGEFIINPTLQELEKSDLSLVMSATENALVMLEGWAKEIDEFVFMDAIKFGYSNIQEIVRTLHSWKREPVMEVPVLADSAIDTEVASFLSEKLQQVWQYPVKQQRSEFYGKLLEELKARHDPQEHKILEACFKKNLENQIRHIILDTGKRFDGRGPEEIRQVECSVGVLPRTHGSALFTRGQTQCLASLTLGTKSDQQIIDGLFEESTKRFMIHYNFPPFSVGEVSPLRGPSRREIGHGALAERSLQFLIPSEDEFPYTIRIVANILESNGSSSMATVCSSSLALMDGAVPIPRHVAGVAIGMIKEGDRYILLTDIAGEEDHVGDLDLKFAGTELGITGFQMDVKTTELSWEILEKALSQSKKARLEILEKMNAVISASRSSISVYAPRIVRLKINPEKIGLVIGGGGKTIRRIIEETGTEIDIEDDGTVIIASPDTDKCQKAVDRIKAIVEEPEIGKIYDGVVSRIFNFGAMIKFLNDQEGLVHISELAPYRVNRVEDIAKVGSPMKVKFIGFDEQGRANLSRKQALTEEELAKEREMAPERRDTEPHDSASRHTRRGSYSGKPPRRHP